MTDDRIAELARALGHPARVRLVRLLAGQSECRGAEVFAELPLAQSTVSEHLKILREAGLVNASPAGASTVYCLVPGALDEMSDALRAIVESCDSSSSCC